MPWRRSRSSSARIANSIPLRWRSSSFSIIPAAARVFGWPWTGKQRICRREKHHRMNPDKLFDYLEGRLPEAERRALEQRLVSDEQLRREVAVARQIYPHLGGESREDVLAAEF